MMDRTLDASAAIYCVAMLVFLALAAMGCAIDRARSKREAFLPDPPSPDNPVPGERARCEHRDHVQKIGG